MQFQKIYNVKLLLLFHQWHFVHFLYFWHYFFTFSYRHLESQIDTYVKGRHVYKDIYIWTPAIDAQVELNNPVDKYTVCIRKSEKVVGHLKKERSNWYIWKNNILFPKRWSLFESKNINIWAQMQCWWWWRFKGSLQTKACWSTNVYRLIARWTYQTERNLNW